MNTVVNTAMGRYGPCFFLFLRCPVRTPHFFALSIIVTASCRVMSPCGALPSVMPAPPSCFDQEHLKAQTTGPETERGAETAPALVRNATVCTAVFPPGPRSAGSFRNSRPLICRPFASAQAQQWLRLPQAPAGSNPGRPSQDTHQGIDGRCRDPRDAALHQHNAYRFQR